MSDDLRNRLQAIYADKKAAGLLDVRFDVTRGATEEAIVREVLALEEAVARGEFRALRFHDSKAPPPEGETP